MSYFFLSSLFLQKELQHSAAVYHGLLCLVFKPLSYWMVILILSVCLPSLSGVF